jgi:hypothetical protein
MGIYRFLLTSFLLMYSVSFATDITLQEDSKDMSLPKLRGQIEDLEKDGKLLQASQEMDRLLKLQKNPTLEELCYALDLNLKTKTKERQTRVLKLSNQISALLHVKKESLVINLCDESWKDIKPYAEYLIVQTALDPFYEQRKFTYKVLKTDVSDYFEWGASMMNQYRYPLSIGLERYDDIFNLLLTNDTKKEEDARKIFSYRFYKGDTSALNLDTLYNLVVRAGLTWKNFTKGKYEYQDTIFVKPFLLTSLTLEESVEEIIKETLLTLEKSTELYTAFVFEPNSKGSITFNDLMTYANSMLSRTFFSHFKRLATIIEPKEKRLYLCFSNDKRNILDLHGLSATEGLEKVTKFIHEKFFNLETTCSVITGKGNHSINNKGVMFDLFPQWIKSFPLKHFIKKAVPIEGVYKIILHKPKTLKLTGGISDTLIDQITQTLLDEDKKGNNRLLITHQKDMPLKYYEILSAYVSVKLFQKHSFSKILYMKDAPNALHFIWEPKKEE